MVESELYTLGIQGGFGEYRVHVFLGKVIAVQKKRRRNGWAEMENFSRVVRTYGNGWIFATTSVEISDEVKDIAIQSVQACGLDFGAVDIAMPTRPQITRYEGEHEFAQPSVIEINTAPGLSSPTVLSSYVNAIKELSTPQSGFGDDIEVPEFYKDTTLFNSLVGNLPTVTIVEALDTVIASGMDIDFDKTIEDAFAVDFSPQGGSFWGQVGNTGDTPSQFNYNRVRELGCFNETVAAIGEVAAFSELFTVVSSNTSIRPRETIGTAFNWSNSPQGHSFWSNISRGELPENYQSSGNITSPLFTLVKSLADSFGGINEAISAIKAAKEANPLTFDATSSDLLGLFGWGSSPQGYDYWARIEDGQSAEVVLVDGDYFKIKKGDSLPILALYSEEKDSFYIEEFEIYLSSNMFTYSAAA